MKKADEFYGTESDVYRTLEEAYSYMDHQGDLRVIRLKERREREERKRQGRNQSAAERSAVWKSQMDRNPAAHITGFKLSGDSYPLLDSPEVQLTQQETQSRTRSGNRKDDAHQGLTSKAKADVSQRVLAKSLAKAKASSAAVYCNQI
jgi:hypothetical protein